MSGGHFDYKQYEINGLIDGIERLLNKKELQESETGDHYSQFRNIDEDYYVRFMKELSPETIEEFKRAIRILKLAETYTQRIDWLVSGDDSEKCFHERLQEGIKNLGMSANVVANI